MKVSELLSKRLLALAAASASLDCGPACSNSLAILSPSETLSVPPHAARSFGGISSGEGEVGQDRRVRTTD